MQPTPIPDAYWLSLGRLLAGEYPGARAEAEARAKLRAFLSAGITFFLDLTEPTEGLQPYALLLAEEAQKLGREIQYQRFAIRDLDIPSLEGMREIQTTIRAALETGQVIYVHCWGGIGRTGTVAGCYLVEQGMHAEAALALIAQLRQHTPDGYRISPETAAQREFVRRWQRSINAS